MMTPILFQKLCVHLQLYSSEQQVLEGQAICSPCTWLHTWPWNAKSKVLETTYKKSDFEFEFEQRQPNPFAFLSQESWGLLFWILIGKAVCKQACAILKCRTGRQLMWLHAGITHAFKESLPDYCRMCQRDVLKMSKKGWAMVYTYVWPQPCLKPPTWREDVWLYLCFL